jgi:single-strand DNA-binding protein
MVNKCILVGRVGRPPEMNYTPQGTEVCKFSLATDESYTKKDGSKEKKTEWHNLVTWGNLDRKSFV